MDLKKAKELCLELMDKHGLTKEKNWRFGWINSQSTAGCCSYKINRGEYSPLFLHLPKYPEGGKIQLSKFITSIHTEEKVRDTILHEIAHGLTKGHDHDYVWQRKAIEIGCNGQRYYHECEELAEAKKAVAKYIGVCPLCKNEWTANRVPKRDQWCKCAGRRFKQDERIKWVVNSNRAVTKPEPKIESTPNVPIHGSNQFAKKANTSFPETLLNQVPDSYKRMLDKFETEFLAMPICSRDIFEDIIRIAKTTSGSWRTMNREVRKACNIYVVKNCIMTNAEFQEKWFYEGVMVGRTTYGKNAPWAGSYSGYQLPKAA